MKSSWKYFRFVNTTNDHNIAEWILYPYNTYIRYSWYYYGEYIIIIVDEVDDFFLYSLCVEGVAECASQRRDCRPSS